MRSGLASVVLAMLACNHPIYSYEPLPTLPSPADEPARCYRAGEVSVATGSFSWQRAVDTGVSYHRLGAGSVPQASMHTPRTQSYGDRGLVLYRQGRRLGAVEALEVVGDAALVRAQQAVLNSTDRAHSQYPVWRNAAVALGGGGSVAVTVGALWLTADPESDTPAYLLLGGSGALLVALIPAVVAYFQLPSKIAHERDERLIVNQQLAAATAQAAERYNQALAVRCGHSAASVATTDGARDFVAPATPR